MHDWLKKNKYARYPNSGMPLCEAGRGCEGYSQIHRRASNCKTSRDNT